MTTAVDEHTNFDDKQSDEHFSEEASFAYQEDTNADSPYPRAALNDNEPTSESFELTQEGEFMQGEELRELREATATHTEEAQNTDADSQDIV